MSSFQTNEIDRLPQASALTRHVMELRLRGVGGCSGGDVITLPTRSVPWAILRRLCRLINAAGDPATASAFDRILDDRDDRLEAGRALTGKQRAAFIIEQMAHAFIEAERGRGEVTEDDLARAGATMAEIVEHRDAVKARARDLAPELFGISVPRDAQAPDRPEPAPTNQPARSGRVPPGENRSQESQEARTGGPEGSGRTGKQQEARSTEGATGTKEKALAE